MVDLSKASREDAVMEAVANRFKNTVAEQMTSHGLTVRGLARAAALKKPTNELAAALSPAKYESHLSCAKVEVVNGRIFYTATASIQDTAAGVLGAEGSPVAYVVSYEVEAEITPGAELDNFVFRRLGVATPVKRADLLERSGKTAPVGQCHDATLR
jgi:hypothetical protein